MSRADRTRRPPARPLSCAVRCRWSRSSLLAVAAYAAVGTRHAFAGGAGAPPRRHRRFRGATSVAGGRWLYVVLYIAIVALSLPGGDLSHGRRRIPVRPGGRRARRRSSAPRSAPPSSSWWRAPRSANRCCKRAGPRAAKLAQGFRDDAFNYLLFLRLVPAFPFFLVNLVPAFAGVRLTPFVAATALGIIPGAFAFAFAGTGLDSVIAAQKAAYDACLAAGRADCQLDFSAAGILTPQLIGALVALGLLALLPVVVKRWRGRRRAAM